MSMNNPGTPNPGRITDSRRAEVGASVLLRMMAVGFLVVGVVTAIGSVAAGAWATAAVGALAVVGGGWLLWSSFRKGIRRS